MAPRRTPSSASSSATDSPCTCVAVLLLSGQSGSRSSMLESCWAVSLQLLRDRAACEPLRARRTGRALAVPSRMGLLTPSRGPATPMHAAKSKLATAAASLLPSAAHSARNSSMGRELSSFRVDLPRLRPLRVECIEKEGSAANSVRAHTFVGSDAVGKVRVIKRYVVRYRYGTVSSHN